MTDERHTQESVLTPEFARALVLRIAAFRIASVLLEDLSQEALLRGVRAFQRIHVEHPSAFFAKIVRDTTSDHWRRERVWFPLEDLDPRRHSYILRIEERIDLERRVEQLREALRYLSPQERQLIHLHYGDDCSLGHLSAMSGKSISALKMMLLRARAKIRRAIAANCRNRDFTRSTKARSHVS